MLTFAGYQDKKKDLLLFVQDTKKDNSFNLMMSTNTGDQRYKYSSLEDDDSFRLILLQPALASHEELQCSLIHTTLEDCSNDIIDHYTALSYVWGDPKNTGTILIDGTSMTITATLAAALRDLRDKSRVNRVWADALCIDQSNMPERGKQVSLMGEIYSYAQYTIIHLGSLTTDQKIFFQNLGTKKTRSSQPTPSKPELVRIAEDNILNLVWFTRVWVFQELVLSRDPWVQCGSSRARWSDLSSVLLASGARGVSKRLQVFADMESSRGVHKQSLFRLLEARRGLGATDSRDMIFALLGVISDVSALENYITIGYDQTYKELYEDVARYLYSTQHNPEDIFQQCARQWNDQTERLVAHDLPQLATWAPDWSKPSASLAPMYTDQTANQLNLDPKEFYTFVPSKSVMTFIGYEVDTISSYSPLFPDPEIWDRNTEPMKEYQVVVDDLQKIYRSGGGVWWSGDAAGRHRHVNIRGKEVEHLALVLLLLQTWSQIIQSLTLNGVSDSDGSVGNPGKEEQGTLEEFRSRFETWVQNLGNEANENDTIWAGSESAWFEGVMWHYLLPPSAQPRVLTGRRLAFTGSGRIAVVPAHAQNDDIVVYMGGCTTSLLFRLNPEMDKDELDNAVMGSMIAYALAHYKTEPGAKTRLKFSESEISTMPVMHCKLVGECYINRQVGWSSVANRSLEDYQIFALH